jgi:tetratricopeptide (TPR) repeat protein
MASRSANTDQTQHTGRSTGSAVRVHWLGERHPGHPVGPGNVLGGTMSEVESTDAVLGMPGEEPEPEDADTYVEEESADSSEAIPATGLADPGIRRLVIALLGVVALFLAAIASALVFGFFSPAGAPRTLLEKNLRVYGSEVDAGGADAATWASYIGALIDAGQLSEARTVLNKALDSAKADRSLILLQQARLEYALKNYAASVDAAEAARLEAEKEQAARVAALTAKGITQAASKSLPLTWLPAVHQKADALVQLGRNAEAIEAYTLYLKESPTDAAILFARGELELKTGDSAAAEADFREALRFIPDYQEALDALEKMGAAAK